MGKTRYTAIARPARATFEAMEPRQLMSVVPAATGPLMSTPYLGAPFSVNQTIEAEYFDAGGQTVAYYDTTPGNTGKTTVRNSSVDIETGGANYDVGWTAGGEWLNYTINVAQAGNYQLQAVVANKAAGAVMHAEVGGVNLTGPVAVPNTGGWQAYQTVTTPAFHLDAGTHVMRVKLDKANALGSAGNYDAFKVIPAPASTGLTLTWHAVAPMPLGLTEAMGEAVGGKLYVFGGYTDNTFLPANTAFCYDPALNHWSRLGNMPVGTTHTGTAVDGQYIYFTGGYPPNSTHTWQLFTTTKVWRYDTLTDTWFAMPALPDGRGAGNMARVGRLLYYFSGADIQRVDRHEMWALNLDNPAAGWQARAPIPTARNHLGAVTLNGKLYAIGGAYKQDSAETALAVVESYDPTTNTWSTEAPLPTPRALIMAGCDAYGGRLIVAGGETGWNLTVNAVTAYDPVTRTWSQLRTLPIKRESGVMKNLGNMLVFTTGHPGFNTDTWIGTFS